MARSLWLALLFGIHMLHPQTWNQYVFQSNLAVIAALWGLHALVDTLHLTLIKALLNTTLFWIAKYVLMVICTINMALASKHVLKPLMSAVRIPYYEYCSGDGPLSFVVGRLGSTFFNLIKNAVTGKSQTNGPTTPPFLNNTGTQASALNAAPFHGPPGSMTSIPQDRAQSAPLLSTSQGPLASLYALKPRQSLSNEHFVGALSAQALVEDAEKIASQRETLQVKLDYVASIPPPERPARRRNKRLWQLQRTPEVVEDFRKEQEEMLRQSWNRFNDRLSKVYYDKLQAWLNTNIFKPLITSIDGLDQEFEKRMKSTFSDCSSNELALLRLYPINFPNGFPTDFVQQLINVAGHDNAKGRRYIISRIKDIGHSKRLAAFSYIAREPGMPTDTQILMHMFEKYLEHQYPRVIPPLVELQGDIFKFLLVYFYVTDDLKDEIFSLVL